jgi:membrane-bound lytic murein transglycosylase A
MKLRTVAVTLLLLIAVAALALWWWKREHGGEGPATLTPVAFADIPGWKSADLGPAYAAFLRSCHDILADPPSKPSLYGKINGDWGAACAASEQGAEPRKFFEDNFQPFSIGSGLITGYYEPLIKGSRTRHGRYQTPVYGRPSDLVSVDLGAFRPELAGQRIAGRVEDKRLVPYPSRAEIDATPPATAPVLFYADDAIAVFFLHIQGSGRVKLDDGSVERVNFDGQNGHPYTPVGRILVEQYGLSREGMSMQVIRAWLLAHPAQMRKVLESDASFVFFKIEPVGDPALGPKGSQGVLLTPRASIAVDAKYNPFGLPVFLAGGGRDGLYIAQDTGGAIRGAARADLFFGFGPDAERDAGGLKAHPDFYILLPKHGSGGAMP